MLFRWQRSKPANPGPGMYAADCSVPFAGSPPPATRKPGLLPRRPLPAMSERQVPAKFPSQNPTSAMGFGRTRERTPASGSQKTTLQHADPYVQTANIVDARGKSQRKEQPRFPILFEELNRLLP